MMLCPSLEEAGHSGGDIAGQLIIETAGKVSQFFHRYMQASVRTDQGDRISFPGLRDIADIDHHLIRAYPAANGGLFPVDKDLALIGQTPWIAVAVPCGNCCQPLFLTGHISTSVTDRSPGRHSLDIDYV